MIVIATGPRSNGTRLLHRILDTADRFGPGQIHPIHFPVYPPEGYRLAAEFPNALFVVILRNPQRASRSAMAAKYHPELSLAQMEQIVARRMLLRLTNDAGDRVCTIRYEDLVEDPQREVGWIQRFLRDHGYTGRPLSLPEPIRDENAKYAVAA